MTTYSNYKLKIELICFLIPFFILGLTVVFSYIYPILNYFTPLIIIFIICVDIKYNKHIKLEDCKKAYDIDIKDVDFKVSEKSNKLEISDINLVYKTDNIKIIENEMLYLSTENTPEKSFLLITDNKPILKKAKKIIWKLVVGKDLIEMRNSKETEIVIK